MVAIKNSVRIHKSLLYKTVEDFSRFQKSCMGKVFLYPFAKGYQLISLIRIIFYNYFYKAKALPGKTISVGNIVSGGSGKTPVIIAIGKYLEKNNIEAAVVTRGYRSGLRYNEYLVLKSGVVVMKQAREKKLMLDEPLLISHALPDFPVIVGANRFVASMAYLKKYLSKKPQYFLLDDAFQHLKIKRDLNIVLLDACSPFADNRLLPAGMLRELPSALKRADLVVFTRAQENTPHHHHLKKVERYVSQTASIAFPTPVLSPSRTTAVSFSQALNPAMLICGVANPQRVLTSLENLTGQISIVLYFADHEVVNRNKVLNLLNKVNSLIMTAKDYYRDQDFYDKLPLPIFLLTLELEWKIPI